MVMQTLTERWGKVVAWTLLSLTGIGALVLAVILLPQWTQARVNERNNQPTLAATAAKVRRLDDRLLTVPPEVLRALDIRTTRATMASQARTLPSLTGSLALDTNRLVRVHTRFAGEVVQLGTLNDDPKQRPLRHGDQVKSNQLLAVIWSKDLGEKKSDLVNALSQLRIDQALLDRLRAGEREGVVSATSVQNAEKTVESDLISVARSERTLRSWRLTEAEIDAVRAEAKRLATRGSEDRKAHEEWARVEVRAPQEGLLLEKNISVGDLVDTSADLFKVADMSRLSVWVHVYEEDLPKIQELPRPISWTISLTSQPSIVMQGQVDQIASVIDPNQHTALMTGQVDNSSGLLRAGQFVTATIKVPPSKYEVEVPTGALVEDGFESVVFVQPDPDKPCFERRRVCVARRFQDVVYLQALPQGRDADKMDTIRPGERVVSSGAVLLNEAMADLPVQP
jgi:cobalt-zinc-cadmium efflux system membrane fusion protein